MKIIHLLCIAIVFSPAYVLAGKRLPIPPPNPIEKIPPPLSLYRETPPVLDPSYEYSNHTFADYYPRQPIYIYYYDRTYFPADQIFVPYSIIDMTR